MNNGIFKAVHEIKRFVPLGKNTGVLAIHRLFLEKYEYFDFGTGRVAYMLRVIKPIMKYYKQGGALNRNGIYHLRSYLLPELGYLVDVNSWVAIPVCAELEEVQNSKRQAWLQAREASLDLPSEEAEMDLGDEYPTVVPDSLSGGSQSTSDMEVSLVVTSTIPVYA